MTIGILGLKVNVVVSTTHRLLGHAQDVELTNLGCASSIITNQAIAVQLSLILGEVRPGKEHIPDMVGNRQLIRKPVMLKRSLCKVKI